MIRTHRYLPCDRCGEFRFCQTMLKHPDDFICRDCLEEMNTVKAARCAGAVLPENTPLHGGDSGEEAVIPIPKRTPVARKKSWGAQLLIWGIAISFVAVVVAAVSVAVVAMRWALGI